MAEDKKPRRLNGEVARFIAQVVLLLSLLATVLRGGMWLDGRLDTIETTLQRAGVDRWRGGDMIVFGEQLQTRNPELNVPDPAVIIRERMRREKLERENR